MTTSQTAFLFFAILTVILAAVVVRLLVRSPYNWVQSIFFFINVLLTRLLWRTHAPDHLPLLPGEGGVIVSNHRSSVDPFFIQLAAGRVVHWMVAREYVDHPAFAWFLKPCEVIPVGRRGVDTAATKAAIRYVSQGDVIGVFPEGRINVSEELMLPCRPGAAMIALKAKAKLVPCFVAGSPYRRTPWSPFFMGARVKVVFGEPIDVSAYDERNADDVQALMIRCLEEIAVLAGRLDFEPQLAGKRWMASREQIEADMDQSERRKRKPR